MSILTIKQIVKGSGADKFGLWSGTTQLKAQVIGSVHLLETLNDGKKNTAKLMKTTQEQAEQALVDAQDSLIVECNGKIVNEFKLIKRSDSVELDLDGFFIQDDYMVDDEDAPERILNIVTELRECINQMFEIKGKTLDDNADACRENIYSTCRTEDDRVMLSIMINGKAIAYPKDTIKVSEVIDTIHFYNYRYPGMVAREYSKQVVTSKGKKYLNGAVLYCEDGCVKIGNLSKFNAEVQQVVSDMIGYFQLSK